MSRFGSGEVITVPHHVKTQSVSTLITSTSLCPYPLLLPVFPVIRPVVGLMRRTPARAIFNLVAASLGGSRKAAVAANDVPAANAGPPSEDRRFMKS